jgi:hypothetical protein
MNTALKRSQEYLLSYLKEPTSRDYAMDLPEDKKEMTFRVLDKAEIL